MAFNLRLKWGSIKGWSCAPDDAVELLQKWDDLGISMSAAMHRDTPEQKEIICQVIDLVDGKIVNDWSGETMTKESAKKYVMEYRT